jgi:hypothetical protein
MSSSGYAVHLLVASDRFGGKATMGRHEKSDNEFAAVSLADSKEAWSMRTIT